MIQNGKRHIGKISNTDQRCVVVFLQIPGREDHALVVTTDTLHPRFEQAVMDILQSPEGQAEETFANVLNRRLMPDSNKSVLQSLHEGGMLTPVPVANVLMTPRPNMVFPLAKILEAMGRMSTPALAEVARAAATPDPKFNPHLINQTAATVEQKEAIARNLLVEADLLLADAERKRQQAYHYAPHLNVRPAVATTSIESAAQPAETTAVTRRRPRRKASAL